MLDPNDADDMGPLARRVADFPFFWDDRNRVSQEASIRAFYTLFQAPGNLVFELNGDGVLAVANVQPGWRAMVHVLAWGKRAMGRPGLYRHAALAAVRARDLVALEGVTPVTHPTMPRAARLALANLRRTGMRRQGILKGVFQYEGQVIDGVWSMITREELENG